MAHHGGADSTRVTSDRVDVWAADGSTAGVQVPFGPLPETTGAEAPAEAAGSEAPESEAAGVRSGLAVDSLVDHVLRPRRIGLVLVRLGAYSVGVVQNGTVEHSSTGRNLVHGRNKAGGWSQKRFARRREGQSRRAVESAADAVARILLPEQARLDALVLGGDRQALESVRADSRLGALLGSAQPRVLDVPEPRRSVLDAAARRATAVEVEVREAEYRE